jgi:hypothetical protein
VLGPEPSGERGGEPFVVELALTAGQKEQIRRVTGDVFVSLRIGPHDFPVTYHETWDDLTPLRVGRTMVVKPAGKAHETLGAERIIELPAGDGSGRGVFGPEGTRRRDYRWSCWKNTSGPGDRVLDLGTGSGILAVAAAKLGAGDGARAGRRGGRRCCRAGPVSLNGLAGVVEVGQGSIESAAPPLRRGGREHLPQRADRSGPELGCNRATRRRSRHQRLGCRTRRGGRRRRSRRRVSAWKGGARRAIGSGWCSGNRSISNDSPACTQERHAPQDRGQLPRTPPSTHSGA